MGGEVSRANASGRAEKHLIERRGRQREGTEKNEAYAELIQVLDDKSLCGRCGGQWEEGV